MCQLQSVLSDFVIDGMCGANNWYSVEVTFTQLLCVPIDAWFIIDLASHSIFNRLVLKNTVGFVFVVVVFQISAHDRTHVCKCQSFHCALVNFHTCVVCFCICCAKERIDDIIGFKALVYLCVSWKRA